MWGRTVQRTVNGAPLWATSNLLCVNDGWSESATCTSTENSSLDVGVPVIRPELASRLRPEGNAFCPSIVQRYGGCPPIARNWTSYFSPATGAGRAGVTI